MAWKWRTLDRERWAEAGELLAILGARYPVLVGRPTKPLAIGTGDRLKVGGAEIGLTEDQVYLAMVRITRTSSYLAALARGGPRYDLDGEIAGEVSAPDRNIAAKVLAARRERRKRNEAVSAAGSEGSDQQVAAAELRDAEADRTGEPDGTDDRAAA